MLPQSVTAQPVAEEGSPKTPDTVREVHVFDRLVTIFRHLKLVLAVFLVVVSIGAFNSMSTIPRYAARAMILIQDERSVTQTNLNPNNPIYYEDPEPYFNTQFQILRGRALAQRVVQRLDLVNRGLPQAEQREFFGVLSSIRTWIRRMVWSREAGAPVTSPADGGAVPASERENAVIAQFIAGIEVIPVTGTRLVEVKYDSTDPQFAALAVNTLVEEYMQQNLDLRLRDIENTLAWLEDQLGKQRAKLESAEKKLSDYRTQQDAASLDKGSNIIGDTLNRLTVSLTDARTARLQKEAEYNQIKDVDPKSPMLDNYAAVASNPTIQQLKSKLSALEAEKAKNSATRGPEHPDMVKLDREIATVSSDLQIERMKVVEGIKSAYRTAVANENGLANALKEQERKAAALGEKASGYTLLQREAEGERDVYQSLLAQDKALRVIRNSRANNIQFMDRAEVPKAPYVPDHRRNLLMAIVLGLSLAVGLAYGIEYLDDTIKTPDDVTRRLQLPLLGLVPAMRGDRSPVLERDVPHDFGEAFRSLRTSLVFTSKGDGARMLGVTSTQPLEGKTTTAYNLAMVLAYGGARVLLIDADMRRPGLHRTMHVHNRTGLSHVLTGQARVREVVQQTSEPNLFVITAGRTPPNPSELLASDRMRRFLGSLGQGPFDWIIIDTPPVLAVTDAVILASQLSGFIFVIGSEMTRRAHAERAIETLQTANTRAITGVVLNRVNFNRDKYYYSRYYGYQYKSYYGQDTPST